MELQSSAAEIIRTARLEAGFTQLELALRAQVTQSVISAYESGTREPSFVMLKSLVSAAGFDIEITLNPVTRTHFFGPVGRRVEAKRSRLRRIIAGYGAKNPQVFGSVARNEDRKNSDLDILVEIPKNMSLVDLGELESELEEVLGVPVEVVPMSDLKSGISQAVFEDLVSL